MFLDQKLLFWRIDLNGIGNLGDIDGIGKIDDLNGIGNIDDLVDLSIQRSAVQGK